jgi:hypothetical protein
LLPIKNQFNSYSCVGQAWAYYLGLLNAKETGVYSEASAKAIYSQISLGFAQGAYIRDGAKLAVSWGEVMEKIIKSYKPDGTTDEEFMMDKSWLTPEITEMAKILQAKEYRLITGMGIDYFARAIKDGFGMVAGIEGINNGTWFGEEPDPPTLTTPQNSLWGHALFFGKFGVDEKGKYIATPNSWGNRNPNTWQKFRENWFANDNRWVFNPWTLVDKSNNNFMITFKKLANEPHIWVCNEEKKTRCMMIDMPTLIFFQDSFETVANLDEYKVYGTMALFERVIN